MKTETSQTKETAIAYEPMLGVVKPKVKLSNTDGNVFALLGQCTKALRKEGLQDKAKQLTEDVFNTHSYSDALAMMSKYVDAY